MGIVLEDTILKALTRARSEGLDERQAAGNALAAVLRRHPDIAPATAERAIDQVRRQFAKLAAE